jgi:hypothetical protein
MRPSRERALEDVYSEAEQRSIKIITDADPEVAEYMDHAAARQGIRPEDMHAITLGTDTILIRERFAGNVRVLREELIHTQQQIKGLQVDPGRDVITTMELDARYQLLQNKDSWALTAEEIAEIEREIIVITQKGRY